MLVVNKLVWNEKLKLEAHVHEINSIGRNVKLKSNVFEMRRLEMM